MGRKISLLLIMLLVFASASCAGSKTDTDSPNEKTEAADAEIQTEETKEEILPELPEANYGGYEFRILNTTQEALHWMTVQLVAEEETGDVLNDEIYRRNLIIEDRYKIRLKETAVGGTAVGAGMGAVRDQARKSILSNSDEYDLVMAGTAVAFDMMKQGMFLDFKGIPYIDLEKPWWDKNLIKEITIAGKLYTAPGDFSLTHYSTTLALNFNKSLVRDRSLDDPYKLVRENKWTLGKFFEMMKSCSADLNGDGKYDKEDLYGLAALHFVFIPSLSVGCDMKWVEKDERDIPVLAMENQNFIEKMLHLAENLYAGPVIYDAETEKVEHKTIIQIFEDNRALFFIELLHHSHYFRSMEVDVGFLPHPKYDESQENYVTNIHYPTLMAVPITSADLERTGIVLEALCAESRARVIPAYYDKMLKTKIARDDESEEMLDIMFSTRRADPGMVYWEAQIMSPLSRQIAKGDFGIASFIEKNKAKMEGEISKAVDTFLEP